MAVKPEIKSHKQMRLLRLRFDQIDREFQQFESIHGKAPYKKDIQDYADALRSLIDRACRNSGFRSQPILVDRKKGEAVDIGSVKQKGQVKRR